MTNATLPPVYEGRLGMTTRSSVHITSDAGHTFQATIFTSINADESPELLQDLKDGTINRVRDEETTKEYQLAVPVVVHSPSKRTFTLVLPDSLRHAEFEQRQRVLTQIEADDASAPMYVRGFAVLFDPSKLDQVATIAEPPEAPAPAAEADSSDLAQEREQLATERAQLDALRERFDREREQMDAIETRIAREREELQREKEALAKEKSELNVQALLQEEQRLNEESGGPTSNAEEATQIVTDDQFIEVMEGPDDDVFKAEEELASEVSEIAEDPIEDFEPDATLISPLTTGLPNKFNDFKVLSERVVELRDRHVVAAAKMEREDIEALFRENTQVYVQLHDIDDYPVIGLTLAALDEKGNCIKSAGWALDVKGIQHGKVLAKLEEEVSFRAGLYDLNGTLLRAVEIKAPLKSNVAWIRETARQLAEAAPGNFEKSARQFVAQDFDRVGTLKHNFSFGSFESIESATEAKLGVGIVGFWSTPDRLKYLISNRSFSFAEFQRIQARVVMAAMEFGICMGQELRDVAVALELVDSEDALVELLTANFAEVCIGLRPNDLDMGTQWENWDALLGLGEELGIPPDPDVVELAEISLKRAQELAELEEDKAEQGAPTPPTTEQTLIVARRSESTGVTYFLPEDSVMDSFDDMTSMTREDLELMLNDPNGRVEAAQVLIDKFGAPVIGGVLDATENMNEQEAVALAKFVETKAGGFEGDLVKCVEEGNSSAVWVAAHALAGMRSASAIPALLDALGDENRQGDVRRLAQTLAQYGERILPSLTRAIKRDGGKEAYTELLAALETVHPGTLSNLSKDRSKVLRDAARDAREKRN